MSQELQDYIAQARKVGKSDEKIAKTLLDKGWKYESISEAMQSTTAKSNNSEYLLLNKKQTAISIAKTSLKVIGIVICYFLIIGVFIMYGFGGSGPDGLGVSIILFFLLFSFALIRSLLNQASVKNIVSIPVAIIGVVALFMFILLTARFFI